MRNHDPQWMFEATFTDGATVPYMADTKALAYDHGMTLARDFGRTLKSVKRIKHVKDMTLADDVQLGAIHL